MNIAEVIALIEAGTKFVEALKGIGFDISGIKITTPEPLALPPSVMGLLSFLKLPKA